MAARTLQLGLFGGAAEPGIDPDFASLRRVSLDEGAWVDVAPGWLTGEQRLFDLLVERVPWRAEKRTMYEREVAVPRLVASLEPAALHPVIDDMRRALDARYGTPFARVTGAMYRDGRDSVAWHGDYVARRMQEGTNVATVSIGGARTFLLRRTGGGPSINFALGHGDLIVMGGTCQRTYQHAIPKVARAEPRIAVMFRPVWSEGA